MGYSRIAANTFFSFIARATELGAGLTTIILAARYLGIYQFGEYAFIRAIVIVAGPIISFGMPRILIRDISINKGCTENLVISGLILNIILGLIAYSLVAMGVISFFNQSEISLQAISIAVFAQIFQIMFSTVCSVFIAYEKILFDMIVIFVSRSLILIFFLAVIVFDLGLISFFYAFALANSIAFIVSFIILYSKCTPIRWCMDIKSMTYLLKEAYPIALAVFMLQGYNNIFIFILKILRDASEISFFQVPQRLIQQTLMIPRSFFLAYVPTLSRMANNNDMTNNLRSTYETILKYILIFMFPICMFLSSFAENLVVLILGEEFINATQSFQILVWVIIILFVNLLLDILLTSIKKQVALIVSSAICLAVSCSLGIILIGKYGYIGACWSMIISDAILTIVNFYFVSKHLGLIPVHRIIIKPLLCCSVLGAFLFEYSGHYHLITLIITGLSMYTALLFLMRSFSREELIFFKRVITVRLKTL